MEFLAKTPLETAATASTRARELYKYFTPPKQNAKDTKEAELESVLSAHAQLVSWRMDTRRALVSLIDRETQYFVAESSKTLDLGDLCQSEDPADANWAGCIDVPKAGRLCEHTLAAKPSMEGQPAYLEVLDLSLDPRFNTLPFVTGEPHFRYYCGVPLLTKKGIPIGSLFAIDDRLHPPASESQIRFLATMAENCMAHLETGKEKEDMRRIRLMNECLAAFVDPENRVKRRKKKASQAESRSASAGQSQFSRQRSKIRASQSSGEKLVAKSIEEDVQAEAGSTASDSPSHVTSATGKQPNADTDESAVTFQIAADLLCRSLSLGAGSGVLFLDTGTNLSHLSQSKASSDESSEDEGSRGPRSRRGSLGMTTHVSYRSWTTPAGARGSQPSKELEKPAELLAHEIISKENSSPLSGIPDFPIFSCYNLERMIRKYPRGMLFNIEEEEVVASSSSGDEHGIGHTYHLPTTKNIAPSKGEIANLQAHFPNARQVIFVPFWNSTWSRYSCFVAYNCSTYRNFDKNPDFLHCIAFCHSISTELTRIATLASDQQKSDFIGSVSHELRSPLHGILASCEFLDETELSSFQKSLVDTADSCARTLLDTINMVLDYSKINAFERSMNRSKRGKRRNISVSNAHLQPALNIYGDVDLAAITEEVVEGVATGQVFKDRLADVDVTDLPPESHLGDSSTSDDSSSTRGLASPNVEIILDIAPRNWLFLTQPGAFRRVVMNVFGNSLKYTKQGYIRVHLHVDNSSVLKDKDKVRMVTLSVKDTGQGISPHYMKTKLFTPFAQESSIAPGTGLGLSLVRSIVKMLNGEIDIQSTVGVGTEVTIKFPMAASRSNVGTSSTTTTTSGSSSTPVSSGSVDRSKDESIRLVQSRATGRTAGYFCLSDPEDESKELPDKIEALRITRETVNHYLKDWYNFDLVKTLQAKALPDIIVVAQADLSILEKSYPGIFDQKNGPMIIVVCLGAYWKLEHSNLQTKSVIEPISFPFGPYKLARIVRVCFDKLDARVKSPATESKTSSPRTSNKRPSPTTSQGRDREELSEVVQAVEQIKLYGDLNVVQQGPMMANAEFAPLMMDALSAQSSKSIEQAGGFPFPPSDPVSPGMGDGAQLESAPITPQAKTPSVQASPSVLSSAVSGLIANSQARSPRVLLVDDNKVNLRLLNAFMNKRQYRDIHLAEDGAAAVRVYNDLINASPPTPPDIIFMDISMPIMNGFEAARRIRDLESSFRQGLSPLQTPASTMIIALTGLASGRDQSEAFTSGFDLYLVKPISFKSVAKLLDSWERNGGAATVGSVPHGSLTEEDVKGAKEAVDLSVALSESQSRMDSSSP